MTLSTEKGALHFLHGFGAALPLKKSASPEATANWTDHSHALFPVALLCPGGRARRSSARY